MDIGIKFYLTRTEYLKHRTQDIIFAICYTSFNNTGFKQLTHQQTSVKLEKKVFSICNL